MRTDEPEDAPLPFVRWSKLSAKAGLAEEEELRLIVEDEGTTLEDFLTSGAIHLRAIAKALTRGDDSLAKAHAAASAAPDGPGHQGPLTTPQPTLPPRGAVPFTASDPEVAASPPVAHPIADAQSGETVADAGHAPDPTLPFGGAVLPTLDQYAVLCAEVDQKDAVRSDVLRRFGVRDEEQLRAYDTIFRKRFQADPLLEARFRALYMEAVRSVAR